jgi:hypothetical protein
VILARSVVILARSVVSEGRSSTIERTIQRDCL